MVSIRNMVTGIMVLLIALTTVSSKAMSQENETPHIDIQTLFTASGWMGDGEYGRKYIDFSETHEDNPHSPPTSIQITYTFGPTRWGGIYWQNIPDNWGDEQGNNYANQGFSKVSFWARGETGKEVVEFKTGGISNSSKPHRDSFRATTGRVMLSKEWKQYEMNLAGSDLKSVIGGFCFVASADYNSAKRIVFFLDDVRLE